MHELTVSAGVTSGLAAFAASKGADQPALFAHAGIEPVMLENPDNRIPFARYIALLRAAQAMCADPALALHYGESVDMSEVSIVGLIMNASETMADAFLQMQRYGRLALEVEGVGANPRFELAQRDGHLWMVDTRANPDEFPELTEGAFARLVCGPRRFLSQPHVLEVHVTHAAPAYRAEYDRIFQCPVTFDSAWNAMRVDPRTATWRVALQPRYVFGVLTGRADALTRDLEASKTTRGRVEGVLLPLLHTGDVGADAVAHALGFSRQTLFRRLKTENTTFEDVLDRLRHRMAVHYLGGRKASVNDTAYLVGFSDPAAFSRAFKRWTGKTPSEARSAGI
ncbi:MAG: AraC family transcriptional regulator [Alphaproteobacteria bacterium]|nr:MAG: AraC family transcriptional regulator [Caulobacteraceae bacterium]TPW05354.1 MAG: AraC family transcriptional regulator [Alphaproteobacteria bacterium]